MKPTQGKRTTTQPGLGKVDAKRRSTLGAGIEAGTGGDASVESSPISAPSPSGGNPAARTTQSLEKAAPTSESTGSQPPASTQSMRSTPSDKPVSSERGRAQLTADPRADGEPSSSGRIERVERVDRVDTQPRRVSRQAIDVVTVDKQRPRRSSSKPPSAKPASRPPGDLDRRASVGGFSAVEIATGRRAVAGTAGAPVAMAVAGPARSKRVSIREDNIGKGIKSVADAVGATGRVVPKLLKSKAEIAAAPIDHRAGFLLAHVDGVTSVAGLVDICGMPEEEVEQILERLRRLGIVAVR